MNALSKAIEDVTFMNNLNDKYILKCLISGGWHIGRKNDISYYDSVLRKEGYVINKHARDVLVEWGGVYVRNIANENYNGVDINFDPIYYASGKIDRLEEFEERANEELYPIGGVQSYILYVGKSGKIYMGIMDVFYFVGNDIEEFIYNMFKKLYSPKEL